MNGDEKKQQPAPDTGDASWQYKPEDTAPPPSTPEYHDPATVSAASPEVTWTASEFIAHNKGLGWFSLLALATAVLAALIYLITRDTISVGIIIFVAALLAISASRKPRVLEYHIDRHGITIGQKSYSFSDFKSFAVMQEGAFANITFLPLKRFMPPISIYYDPADEERIIAVLATYLPMEHRTHDMIDRFVSRIRF